MAFWMALMPEKAMKAQSFTAQTDFIPAIMPAVHRVPGAFGGGLRDEVVPGGFGRQRFRRDLLLRQPPAQIVEGERHVEQLRVLRGFELLGDAGPDEHDADVRPEVWRSILQCVSNGESKPVRNCESAGRCFCR